eukprot:1183169-Prorocentrum_minimum.AAC.1
MADPRLVRGRLLPLIAPRSVACAGDATSGESAAPPALVGGASSAAARTRPPKPPIPLAAPPGVRPPGAEHTLRTSTTSSGRDLLSGTAAAHCRSCSEPAHAPTAAAVAADATTFTAARSTLLGAGAGSTIRQSGSRGGGNSSTLLFSGSDDDDDAPAAHACQSTVYTTPAELSLVIAFESAVAPSLGVTLPSSSLVRMWRRCAPPLVSSRRSHARPSLDERASR